MIAKFALRVMGQFGRLNKPRLNKVENIFELMRDRSTQLKYIESTNNFVLNTTKFTKPEEQLSAYLGISGKISKEVLNTVVKMNAYSPIWNKPYRVHQKIDGELQIDEKNANIETPYHPSHLNLKFHYSINKDVPQIEEYKLDKATAYIFNLPDQIDEKSLLMELGYRLIKNIKIYYCMLGLPAYAEVQFNSENALAEKMMSGQIKVKIGDRECILTAIGDEQKKFSLERRQIVIKGVDSEETPASMLKKLSAFGKVMHVDLPLQIYRQPSLQQIKELYKNQRSPIQINYHRGNGTIESEYYPPLQNISSVNISNLEAKQEQYKRRLRYCETVDVFEGKAGQVRTRSRGYCIVTYSCQEQAQNCYLQVRNSTKVELLENKYQFEFDDKHREALLRFIDNSYIQKCLDNNPNKQFNEEEKKHNSLFFQSLYMETVYNDFKSQVYFNLPRFLKNIDQESEFQEQHRYREYLSLFKNSIGVGNINQSASQNNQYGKSFDELAEQQLYGMKLKEKSLKPRYDVNIDDYIREPVRTPKKRQAFDKTKKEVVNDNLEQILHNQQVEEQRKMQEIQQQALAKLNAKTPEQIEKLQKQQQKQINQSAPPVQKVLPAHGKKKFSTAKIQQRYSRPKSMSQKIKAHVAYNRFVRDTINEYMGIFPIDKMQSELYRKKLTFVNPQGLRFEDGSEFITQEDVKGVLQYSTNLQQAQDFYNSFIRANEIAKSTSVDIEESVMKDFDENVSEMLYEYSDVGVVKEEIKYDGNEIEKVVAQLNMEAEFGEEYKIVEDEETHAKRIIKVAKLEFIYPIEAIQKIRQQSVNFKKSQEFDPSKLALVLKYRDYFTNGQPVPDQFAEAFGLQKNEVIDLSKQSQQMCQKLNMNKKDMQKFLNMQNYTPEQLGADYENQKQLFKARKRRSSKKATDYGRNPSQIKTRDKDGKAVVSKFRQI